MRPPAIGAQVNFHVAGTRRFVPDLQNGVAKIRPAFDADESGVKNADGVAVGGFEPVALQPLMLPDGLEQAFGRQSVVVMQLGGRRELRPPDGVEIFGCREHFMKFLRIRCVKVKQPVLF